MKLGPKEIKVVNQYFVRPVKNKLKEIFMKKGLPQLKTPDEVQRPQSSLDREMFEGFNKRNPKANGGRIGLKGGADAATASFSQSVGSTRPGRKDPVGGFNLSGGQGPTFGGAPPTTGGGGGENNNNPPPKKTGSPPKKTGSPPVITDPVTRGFLSDVRKKNQQRYLKLLKTMKPDDFSIDSIIDDKTGLSDEDVNFLSRYGAGKVFKDLSKTNIENFMEITDGVAPKVKDLEMDVDRPREYDFAELSKSQLDFLNSPKIQRDLKEFNREPKAIFDQLPDYEEGGFFKKDQEPTTPDEFNEYLDSIGVKRMKAADGGMLVQPSDDGSRPGYAKITEKGKSTPKGGRPIPENIVMADDTKAVKELQNKVDKLNRVNKLDDKGVKFRVVKTQAGNYTTELSYLAKDYRETLGKIKSTGSLNKLTEEFNQFKKTNLFKNYSKSASMKAGGVKSAKKQLADIGSKKEDVFNYLLNNKNASIEEIAKDLKLKEGVVRTNLQGLYTDIYKRTADQGAVYLKDFNINQLDSVHSSIKNTKVPLKDRVKNLVIDAYKGNKNLKPILEKLDNFYTLQSEIKKTPYGKFFAANLDHPVPLNFIRQLEEGADPFNLIKIKPIPEFLNQRAFKAQFDRVLGTAYRTGNKKVLEAIVNVQSYLPQEFGGITPDGKIKDYGAKPFSLKTNLDQANFPEIYKKVFDFIKNPELQETFKQSKVSFKNLAGQEKNIMKQASGYKKQLKELGEQGFQLSANPIFSPGILKEAFKQLPTPAGAVGLNLLFGVDPTSAVDRAGIAAEAAFAPALVKQAAKLGPVGQKIANLGLTPAMAARVARIASPLGIVSLAGEGLYQGGKYMLERKKLLDSLTDKQRDELLRREKREAVGQMRRGNSEAFDPFQAAGGGLAKLAGDRSGAMLTSMNPDKDGLQGLSKRVKKQ